VGTRARVCVFDNLSLYIYISTTTTTRTAVWGRAYVTSTPFARIINTHVYIYIYCRIIHMEERRNVWSGNWRRIFDRVAESAGPPFYVYIFYAQLYVRVYDTLLLLWGARLERRNKIYHTDTYYCNDIMLTRVAQKSPRLETILGPVAQFLMLYTRTQSTLGNSGKFEGIKNSNRSKDTAGIPSHRKPNWELRRRIFRRPFRDTVFRVVPRVDCIYIRRYIMHKVILLGKIENIIYSWSGILETFERIWTVRKCGSRAVISVPITFFMGSV